MPFVTWINKLSEFYLTLCSFNRELNLIIIKMILHHLLRWASLFNIMWLNNVNRIFFMTLIPLIWSLLSITENIADTTCYRIQDWKKLSFYQERVRNIKTMQLLYVFLCIKINVTKWFDRLEDWSRDQ